MSFRNVECGRIVWNKPGWSQPLITAKGGVGTQPLIEAVYETPSLDPAIQRAVAEVINQGSSTIRRLMHGGGVVNFQGQILLEPLPNLSDEQRRQLGLDGQVIVTSQVSALQRAIKLSRDNPGMVLLVIDNCADEQLLCPQSGLGLRLRLVRKGYPEGYSVPFSPNIIKVLAKTVGTLPTQAEQRIMSNDTIVRQILYEIANSASLNT